jgi:hypothetical protein
LLIVNGVDARHMRTATGPKSNDESHSIGGFDDQTRQS